MARMKGYTCHTKYNSYHGQCIFLTLLVIVVYCHTFEIVENTINSIDNYTDVETRSVIFKCASSDWYEFCSWKHDSKVCKFEWKRRFGGVRKQECDASFHDRIRFLGNYNKHECQVELSNLTLSDAGKWTCELQSYVLGPISGSSDKASLHLILDSDLHINETRIESTNEHNRRSIGSTIEEDEGKCNFFLSLDCKIRFNFTTIKMHAVKNQIMVIIIK